MVRRTKQEADETRESLLDAAEQVFLDRGVARASLDEVARAAGCTRGAVHWHFGDKLGLFLALDERLLLLQDSLCERLGGCQQTDRPLEDLARAIAAVLRDLEDNPRRRRLLTIMLHRCEYVAEMAPALERRRDADALLRARFLQAFQWARLQGALSDRWTPEHAALILHGLMTGMVHEWLRGAAGFTLSGDVCGAIGSFLTSTMAQRAN